MPNHRLPHLFWNVGCKLQKNHKSKILSSGWVIDIKNWRTIHSPVLLVKCMGQRAHSTCLFDQQKQPTGNCRLNQQIICYEIYSYRGKINGSTKEEA